jgi:hypothetical protein
MLQVAVHSFTKQCVCSTDTYIFIHFVHVHTHTRTHFRCTYLFPVDIYFSITSLLLPRGRVSFIFTLFSSSHQGVTTFAMASMCCVEIPLGISGQIASILQVILLMTQSHHPSLSRFSHLKVVAWMSKQWLG